MKHPTTLDEWLKILETIHPLSMDFKLARIIKVYHRLNLGKIAPLILTVAGTNGKGSTSTTAAYLFREKGLNVGLFTSPHIQKFNERISINLQNVSDKDIVDIFEIIDNARAEITLTYFEFATLAAFCLFKRAKVDIAVLEVGLGGRLDSTNIVDADIAIITPIDIDHTAQLGNTLAEIAGEKAGIIKNRTKVVCAESNPQPSILDRANQQNAEIYLASKDYTYQITNSEHWEYHFKSNNFCKLIAPNLTGLHQYQNSAAAITAALLSPYSFNESEINNALAKVTLLGRFQKITRHHSPTVYLDVTHNPQGARILESQLDVIKKDSNSKIIAIFSMLKDKDVMSVIRILNDSIDQWILCPINDPRGQSGESLAGKIKKELNINYIIEDSIKNGCKKALNITSNNDIILLFGSFNMVNEGISWFKENNYEL